MTLFDAARTFRLNEVWTGVSKVEDSARSPSDPP